MMRAEAGCDVPPTAHRPAASPHRRLPVLDVCTAWHAIVDAGGPALWPTAVIKGPVDIGAGTDDQVEIDAARRPALYDCSFYKGVLDKAAGLSLRLRSLFVDADGTQPEVILSILAIVPAVSLVCLSIKGRCPGPLPLVLQRFRQLQRVELTGDASRVSWEGPGSTRLAGMVYSMELAPVTVDGDSIIGNDLCLSPDRAAHLGAALSQLTRLAITVCWDDDTTVPALVAALPSLQAFRYTSLPVWASVLSACRFACVKQGAVKRGWYCGCGC
jgi:hypothetical protein